MIQLSCFCTVIPYRTMTIKPCSHNLPRTQWPTHHASHLGLINTLFFLEVYSRYPIFLRGRFFYQIDTLGFSYQISLRYPTFFRGRFFYQINTLVFLIRSVCDTLLFLEVDSFIRSIPCFFLSDQFVIPYFLEVNSFVRSITLVFLNRSYINIPFL